MGDTITLPKLTSAELAEYAKLLKKTKLLEQNPVLIEYWKKVKETIHLFDGIIVKYVIQWSAILLAIVGGSAVVFSNSSPELDLSLIAGIVALSAIFICIPIAIKCFFYYELLEEALDVAQDIEKLMFDNFVDKNLANRVGLTHRLARISTERRLGITFFAWTICLPWVVVIVTSLVLASYYFSHFFG